MSYQPGYPDPGNLQPPPLPSPYAAPAASAPMPDPTRATGRSVWMWIGLATIIASLLGAVVWMLGARGAHESSVKALGRVAPGLTTQLNFVRSGTFTMYYESSGEMKVTIDGDEELRQIDGPKKPARFTPLLLDEDGKELAVERRSDTVSYNTAGFTGVSVREFDIDTPGKYSLTITPRNSDDSTFGIAVGRGVIEEPSMIGPLLLGVLGSALGALMMLLAGRRKAATSVPAVAAPGSWMPPASPPGNWAPAPPTQPPTQQSQPQWGAPAAPGTWGVTQPSSGSPSGVFGDAVQSPFANAPAPTTDFWTPAAPTPTERESLTTTESSPEPVDIDDPAPGAPLPPPRPD